MPYSVNYLWKSRWAQGQKCSAAAETRLFTAMDGFHILSLPLFKGARWLPPAVQRPDWATMMVKALYRIHPDQFQWGSPAARGGVRMAVCCGLPAEVAVAIASS